MWALTWRRHDWAGLFDRQYLIYENSNARDLCPYDSHVLHCHVDYDQLLFVRNSPMCNEIVNFKPWAIRALERKPKACAEQSSYRHR